MARKMLGSVDLLGLNAFGENPGMNPLWGTVIGGSVSALTSITLGHVAGPGSLSNNRELIGFLAGGAVAGAMYAMPKTRHAAIGTLLGAFFASGISYLERVLLGTVSLPTATAQTATAVAAQAGAGTQGALGIANIKALNGGGLGLSTVRNLNGGLGLATIANRSRPAGTIPGVAGPRVGNGQSPVHLYGPQTANSRQVHLMGGPQIHGIASHYGATHFSKN